MRRVMILGCSGSGKSTLGRRLGNALDLPIVHMDQHYFYPNWVEKPAEVWSQLVSDMVANDQWVMDGNYSKTFDLRMGRADTIVFLDLPTWFYLLRVIKRILTSYGKVRPDSAPGCPERFDPSFIGYVLNYNRLKRTKILDKLSVFPGELVHLRSVGEIDKFVAQHTKM